MKRLFSIFIIISLKTYSCTCKWEFSEFTPFHLLNYNRIFSGKVLKIDTLSKYQLSVKILTQKTYWGKHNDTIKVNTAIDESMCGYSFILNKEYLIYANNSYEHDHLSVTWCGPTRPLYFEYSDTVHYSIPSFYYTKIDGRFDKYSNKERIEFLNKAWINEIAYLDTISQLENGVLFTKYVNGDLSGVLNISNKFLTDSNYFFYHNNLLKAKGLFKNNHIQGIWHEYHLNVYKKKKKQKFTDFIYYSESGKIENDRRKGIWTKKYIAGNRKLFEEAMMFGGTSQNYD